jgi:hypothetical protein
VRREQEQERLGVADGPGELFTELVATTEPLAVTPGRDKNLCAVATLMLALADGGHAIDEWIAAMEDAGRGGDGQVRRPPLRAGRVEGRDPDPR